LAAAVGVMHELAIGVTSGERHDQRADDEVGGLAFTHRPPGEALVVEVLDAGEVELAVAASELRDVRDPSLVGPLGCEVAFQQVRRGRGVRAPAAPLPTGVGADQATLGHDPRHPLTRMRSPVVTKLALHPR
jgi:hypothetical protein